MNLIVVIVNYKTSSHVLENLKALVPQLRKLGSKAQCWIVDNCSPDNSLSIISSAIEQEKYEDCVTLIPHSLNGGFGAGNNVAIKKALKLETKPDLIYLLNPDAILLPGTLSKMTTYLDTKKDIGIVGGPTLDLNGNIECGAFRFHSLRSTIEENLGIGLVSKLWQKHRVTISPPPKTETPVGWVSGANMMIRREALEKAGIFDEKFFLYFEEVDLCRRIKENGFQIHYLPDAKVIHDAGASTGINATIIRLPKYWHDSRSLYLKKSFGDRGLLFHNLATLIAGSIGYVYRFIRRRSSSRKHYLRDILKYNFGRASKQTPTDH